jgi:hypothetical protein
MRTQQHIPPLDREEIFFGKPTQFVVRVKTGSTAAGR